MYTRGKRKQHGKPDSVVGRGDQLEAGDGQRGRYGVAERPVLRKRLGNCRVDPIFSGLPFSNFVVAGPVVPVPI